jgi:Spy/CpxP family protein refolding chaperone
MNRRLIAVPALLFVASVALMQSPAAHAQPEPELFDPLFGDPMPFRGRGPNGPPPPDRGWTTRLDYGLAGPEGPVPPSPMLRGLALSEAQRDKVFAILHKQAPILREKAKAIRRAQEELRALPLSAQYDYTKAKSVADAGAQALGELTLLRADVEHQIYLVLTSEQRQQLDVIQRPAHRQ